MEFELETRWELPFGRERVFAELAEPAGWPQWWPGVVSAVEDSPGGPDGIGRSGEITWRAPFGYRVRFRMTATRIEPPELLAADSVGDLTGVGTWRLDEGAGADGPVTDVRFSWHVRADKLLMRAGGRLLRPFLVWNHDRMMAAGREGLLAYLSR